MLVLLLSTYDLGRQPFGLASPAAWLRRAGLEVRTIDLSREAFDPDAVRAADVVAIHLPMHTATRLAVPIIERIRREHAAIRIVAYGVYAPPNEAYLRTLGVDAVLGPEAEADLVAFVTGHDVFRNGRPLPRLPFIPPDRDGLPPLSRYASLQLPTGARRVAGYTEATRGCKHRCRHCPIVPVYDGQFRVVPPDVVLADIRAQVAAGAEHITFGDPDFLNGPSHARRIVEALAREWPRLTYDVVVKIEHIVRHRELMAVLRDTGCLFITSAVESVDDEVLRRLDKGHTRADFARAAAWLRQLGLPLVPTFVAFTPWTTIGGYLRMLDTIEGLELVEHVAPVQLAIRLLIPQGSRLLELEEIRAVIGCFDARQLAYPWRHPDPRVDRLQLEIMALVGRQLTAARADVFEAVRALACDWTDPSQAPRRPPPPRVARAAVPYLNEPWYC
jgi:radical SAM superfamily enzyme YgiQ (UPF0313 family)